MRPALVLIALACGLAPAAADGPPPAFPDAVREAVAARKVEDAGELPARAAFRDVADDGAIMVGLEVGLSRFGDAEIPYALRPVFRRGAREWTGGTAGSFAAKEVRRTTRVVARPGYAVGGLWVRGGGALDRICLVFYRVGDTGLDPADTYTSPWVGTSDGGADQYIDGRGRPIVGLTAVAGRDQVRRLGLVVAKVPPVKKPDPKPEPAPKPAEAAVAEPPRLAEQAADEPEDDNSLMLIVLALSAAVGIPAGLVGLMAMGNKGPVPPARRDEERRPKAERKPTGERPAAETIKQDTLADRPELARRLAPYLPARAAAAGDPAESHEAPPFFLARATYRARRGRMTRIYVRAGELLVIDAGSGAESGEVARAAGTAANIAAGGGLIGALVGSAAGAVGAFVADGARAKGEAIQQRLDRLDLDGLLALAGGDGNFRTRIEDLVGVTIDPPALPSFWREGSRAVGTFRFRDTKRGEFTYEFLLGAEVRGAVELLRRVLGKSLHVGTGWDDATAVYLRGV